MVVKKRIDADFAKWDNDNRQWLLNNATIWDFSQGQVIRKTRHNQSYSKLSEPPDYFLKELPKPDYLSFNQLFFLTNDLRHSGFDFTEMKIALQQHVALPFTCIVMVLIGTSFGFTVGRKGVLVSAGSGVLLGIAFWIGLELFEKFGKYDYIHPTLAGWGMNIIFGTIGVYWLFRSRT
jgi:lipopolysaccharide export LptBFGC system permease protein LptF